MQRGRVGLVRLFHVDIEADRAQHFRLPRLDAVNHRGESLGRIHVADNGRVLRDARKFGCVREVNVGLHQAHSLLARLDHTDAGLLQREGGVVHLRGGIAGLLADHGHSDAECLIPRGQRGGVFGVL